jgi:hypothetical protein
MTVQKMIQFQCQSQYEKKLATAKKCGRRGGTVNKTKNSATLKSGAEHRRYLVISLKLV